MNVGTRVYVFGIGFGGISHIHDSGGLIYTVTLDDRTQTPDGNILCRDCELRLETNSERIGFDNHCQ